MKYNIIRSIIIWIIILIFSASCLDSNIEKRTLNDEILEIDNILNEFRDEGLDIDTTESGLYYITNKNGEGSYPCSGDTVSISYNGFFTDWTEFDTSTNWGTDGIWTFVYGEQQLIPGFNEAISLMQTNSEMRFIIPSSLAYGEFGYGNIGSFRTLVYDVKMHNIKSTNNTFQIKEDTTKDRNSREKKH